MKVIRPLVRLAAKSGMSLPNILRGLRWGAHRSGLIEAQA
jgi:hypothetical protein